MRVRVLAAALSAVLAGDAALVAARAGERATPSSAPAATTTAGRPAASPAPAPPPTARPKPKPKPPARLVVAVTVWKPGVGEGKPLLRSVLKDGRGARPERVPAVPGHQVSRRTGKVVASEVLDSGEFYGCGVAGCSTTRTTESGIVVRNVSGGGRKVLTKGGYDTEPSFAPDGSAIAYLAHATRKDGGETDVIEVMTPRGRSLRTYVAPNGGWYAAPMWSPDGRHIAAVYRPNVANATWSLVLLPVGRGPSRTIGRGEFDQLRWAPSSRFLVARAVVRGPHPGYSGTANTGWDLWVVPVKGGQRRLTHLAPPVRRDHAGQFCENAYSELGASDPVVSPDSRLVAYSTNTPHKDRAGRGWDVHVIGVDGRGQRTVWRSPPSRCAGYMQIHATIARPLGWR